METSAPEEIAGLYEENDEIEKIYELLRSGRPLREILNGPALGEVPPALAEPVGTPEASAPRSIETGPIRDDIAAISDCVTDTDQRATADVRPTGVVLPGLGRRFVLELSYTALIVAIVGVSFFLRLHYGIGAPEPPVGRASLKIDPAPIVAPDNFAPAQASTSEAPVSAARPAAALPPA
jgi:hypothetical protein